MCGPICQSVWIRDPQRRIFKILPDWTGVNPIRSFMSALILTGEAPDDRNSIIIWERQQCLREDESGTIILDARSSVSFSYYCAIT